jgi:hypothetical protein
VLSFFFFLEQMKKIYIKSASLAGGKEVFKKGGGGVKGVI